MSSTSETPSSPEEIQPSKSRAKLARLRAKRQAQKIREQATRVRNALTESVIFRTLVDWAFGVCNPRKTNHISSEQLYSGLLLVHLNLARFCGSAACMPPSRQVVNDLFEACDIDGSGGIDRTEFNVIVNVSCAQIFSRVLINYATLIFVMPLVAERLVDRWGIPNGTYLETICEQFAGMFLFVVVVPILWKIVDTGANIEASRQARQQSSRNLTHSMTEGAQKKSGVQADNKLSPLAEDTESKKEL